jgi:hypothetical protein
MPRASSRSAFTASAVGAALTCGVSIGTAGNPAVNLAPARPSLKPNLCRTHAESALEERPVRSLHLSTPGCSACACYAAGPSRLGTPDRTSGEHRQALARAEPKGGPMTDDAGTHEVACPSEAVPRWRVLLDEATSAPRCGATCKRTGQPCRGPAMRNGRCRMHGGASTGPRTPEGRERCRAAPWKHGGRASEARAAARLRGGRGGSRRSFWRWRAATRVPHRVA